ncbi:exonuclease 1 [Orussus abietinus]|uniref:exonuclease 1 n=1 Tax=Orussus abietinus TaxID=222816 RepID=UPI000626E893|nr:exonuclease 1 [Orussus abietinus]
MGITGLIPFLEKSSKRGNISQFSGGSVAIDTYCWLHKGAFFCADKLIMGQHTDAHIKYCMKFIDMLLANKIKPILVFDGRHLPAKAKTETKRRELRQVNRQRAAELMKMGQIAEGRNLLRRSLDITHEMALNLIKECQKRNIDCIVAPYEADAQLAYLNTSGIVDVVITEDSDLTLFGCKKIFFKMDVNGNGVLVEQNRLHLAMGLRVEHFDMDKFRHMCILSGCDYLASLPGIGLSKACKFIVKNTDSDICRALTRLASHLNMKSLNVSEEYRDAFILAVITFKHQLVFCPLQRKQVRLNPPPSHITKEQLHYAGDLLPEDVAWQIALGNCDPFTLKKLHNFDPDNVQNTQKINPWKENNVTNHTSIWSKDYKLKSQEITMTESTTVWPNTFARKMTLETKSLKMAVTPRKRNYQEFQELSKEDLLKMYSYNDSNTDTNSTETSKSPSATLQSPPEEKIILSPVLSTRHNPFSVKKQFNETSPELICKEQRRMKSRRLLRFKPTVIDETAVPQSKFFAKLSEIKDIDNVDNSLTLCNSFENIIHGSDDSKENDNMESDITNAEINTKMTPADKRIRNNEANAYCSQESYSNSNSEPESPLPTDSDNFTMTNTLHTSIDITSVIEEKTSREPSPCSEVEHALQSTHRYTLRSSFFKWTNTKTGTPNSVSKAKVVKPNSKRVSNNDKLGKKAPLKRSVSLEQGQQGLLSMYGFQKKTALKH